MPFRQNLQYTIRLMGKKPLFTAAIVLTLGVCIGAVTAVFSIVDATLLRPLPFPQPDRLGQLVVRFQFEGQNGLQSSQDGNTWEVFSRSVTTIDPVVYSSGVSNLNFSSGGQVEYIRQQRVGSGFFRVFGIPPMIGREFTAEEDVPNGPSLAVLSHGLWQRAFGGEPAVVGKTVQIAGQSYEVVGVAAQGFESNADLWTPLRPSRTGEGRGINYTIVGRLRSGMTWPQAEAEMAAIGQPLLQNRRLRPGQTVKYGLMELQEATTTSLQTSAWIILAAGTLVLVIGCVNIAGMLMARGSSRSSEFAARMAIGADRSSIIRQLLGESLVIALAGGFVGILIGYFSLGLMKSILPPAFSSLQTARLDVRVLTVAAVVSILTSFLFGLFPALQASRVDIRTAQSGRGIAGSSRSRFRRVLSIAQIAIAVAILIGAGLLIRSFRHLSNLAPGFDATNVIAANFALLDARYSKAESANRYVSDVLVKLQELPGVEGAAMAHSLPYERGMNIVVGKPGDPDNGPARLTNWSYITPQFFDVFRIPLLKGRQITESDGPDSPLVVVINDAFSKMYFKDTDPIGAQLIAFAETRQVVGVVGDVLQQAGWGNFGPMGRVPAAYIPAKQSGAAGLRAPSPSWVVRTAGPASALQSQIEQIVESVDPLLPVASFRSLNELKLRSLALQRFMAMLLGIAAGLALLLAAIGIYAMISNSVAERSREFGIRLALGATVGQTIRNSVTPGLACAISGLVIGLMAGRWGTQFLQGMLYGITPADSATYLAVGVGVPAIVAIASLIPALRIIKLDPSQTLRQE